MTSLQIASHHGKPHTASTENTSALKRQQQLKANLMPVAPPGYSEAQQHTFKKISNKISWDQVALDVHGNPCDPDQANSWSIAMNFSHLSEEELFAIGHTGTRSYPLGFPAQVHEAILRHAPKAKLGQHKVRIVGAIGIDEDHWFVIEQIRRSMLGQIGNDERRAKEIKNSKKLLEGRKKAVKLDKERLVQLANHMLDVKGFAKCNIASRLAKQFGVTEKQIRTILNAATNVSVKWHEGRAKGVQNWSK